MTVGRSDAEALKMEPGTSEGSRTGGHGGKAEPGRGGDVSQIFAEFLVEEAAAFDGGPSTAGRLLEMTRR
jgi:hypothetical protein